MYASVAPHAIYLAGELVLLVILVFLRIVVGQRAPARVSRSVFGLSRKSSVDVKPLPK